MITFKIDTADVILDDLGDNQGKIIIADTSWGYNFSYFWGSMGMSLNEFLCKINADYFAGKLGPHEKGEINSKKTIKNIRLALKEYFYCDYPLNTHKEFQKSLKDALAKLEEYEFFNVDNFFHSIEMLLDNDLEFYSIKDNYDRTSIKETLKDCVFAEPWQHLVYDEHKEITYLKKFHKKLIKELKKNKFKPQIIETV